MEWLFNLVGDITIAKLILMVICGFILFLTIASILINLYEWIIGMVISFRLGWFELFPDYKEEIIQMKYEPYVVGFPSGEIFYIDEKKLKKLKKKKLVAWNQNIRCYVFSDDDASKVKLSLKPHIVYENRRNAYYDEI